MPKNVLSVDWQAFSGAAHKRRMLHLKPNVDGMYLCPVANCLHVGFRSQRGLRKHIETRHSWYFYFDEQPKIMREEIIHKGRVKMKQTTHTVAAFSLEDGVGKLFLQWLTTACGGGKSDKEAVQIGRRAMKFLMASLGESEVERYVKAEYVDCCLGSPSVVITFMQTITEDWGLTSSAALNYLKSMCDLLDFRKANGVSDAVLRTFTVTEVYLRRGKENLAKKKRLQYTRNLDLESLIARDSWATIEEMELVIPYHTPKFKSVLEKCLDTDTRPTISEFAFATRFIATFLFLRVKCSRPMTYQFITLDMMQKAKNNGGFIDQTLFKTNEKYTFDTLIIGENEMQILESYIKTIRPLLNPTCDYLLVSTTGRQYNSFTTAMTLLVNAAIGKYINPTRYRQIVETESAEKLDPAEREIISKDQKHSSIVAKLSYRKQLSRDIATQGKHCMEKIVGDSRKQTTEQLADLVCDINRTSLAFDQSVIDRARRILEPIHTGDDASSSKGNPQRETCNINVELHDNVNSSKGDLNASQNDVMITGSRNGQHGQICGSNTPSLIPATSMAQVEAITNDVEVKKEEAEQHLMSFGKSKKFTAEEDRYLKLGIDKYGKGSWSLILHDKTFKFHPKRNRDSLRMRAETCGFKTRKKVHK